MTRVQSKERESQYVASAKISPKATLKPLPELKASLKYFTQNMRIERKHNERHGASQKVIEAMNCVLMCSRPDIVSFPLNVMLEK
jgi:hypothetical protein